MLPPQAAFDELNEPESAWEVINLTIDVLFILDVAKVPLHGRYVSVTCPLHVRYTIEVLFILDVAKVLPHQPQPQPLRPGWC